MSDGGSASAAASRPQPAPSCAGFVIRRALSAGYSMTMVRLRPPSVSKLCLLAGIAAVAATIGFVHNVTKNQWAISSSPTATQSVSPPSAYPSDGHGFVNSSARCDGSQTAVALARTQNSLVAMCADRDGHYVYRGVRLSDGAVLDASAESTGGRQFVARSDGVTYSLSAQQLLITAGGDVIRREPVIEYREQ